MLGCDGDEINFRVVGVCISANIRWTHTCPHRLLAAKLNRRTKFLATSCTIYFASPGYRCYFLLYHLTWQVSPTAHCPDLAETSKKLGRRLRWDRLGCDSSNRRKQFISLRRAVSHEKSADRINFLTAGNHTLPHGVSVYTTDPSTKAKRPIEAGEAC